MKPVLVLCMIWSFIAVGIVLSGVFTGKPPSEDRAAQQTFYIFFALMFLVACCFIHFVGKIL